MAIIDPNGTARVVATGAPAGPPGESAYQVWLSEGNSGSRADFLASQKGADGLDGAEGIDGAGSIITLIATARILPSSAVVLDGRFGALSANPANPAHANLVVGVTALGGEAGGLVTIQGGGDLDGIVGNFSTGDTLFPSTNGTLTRIVPQAGWRQSLGKASAPGRMVVNLGPAYILPSSTTVLPVSDLAAVTSLLLAALTPEVLFQAYVRMVENMQPLPADADIPDAGGAYVNGGQPIVVPSKS